MSGRKSKYESHVLPYLNDINKKIREGVIEDEIAKTLGISVASLNIYKGQHEELREALKTGKGRDVLQSLINSGIEAARGYFRENETTTIILDENGQPTKRQKVVNKVWYKPDPVLNKFYVMNYGKDEGYTGDPLDYELKKLRAEMEKEQLENKDWYKNIE